jgi:hypothetical protein
MNTLLPTETIMVEVDMQDKQRGGSDGFSVQFIFFDWTEPSK